MVMGYVVHTLCLQYFASGHNRISIEPKVVKAVRDGKLKEATKPDWQWMLSILSSKESPKEIRLIDDACRRHCVYMCSLWDETREEKAFWRIKMIVTCRR